jgi:hypothetical protein
MRFPFLAMAALVLASSTPVLAAPDWAAVDKAMGRAGAEQAGGVHRYSFPRSDLEVTIGETRLKPALALGSWLAFLPTDEGTMVMGDLVLTDDEVNPVLSRLLAGGVAVTALHNHLLGASPATMYMHVEGKGDPAKLAALFRAALQASRTPLGAGPAADEAKLDLDIVALDRIMGTRGKPSGGVLHYSFPRAEEVRAGGMAVPATMGTATAINFQPTRDGKAAIAGDFVMLASEVGPVMKTLRSGGIDVEALHNHMLDDSPRLFFMHFGANEDAAKLARVLRRALDRMNLKQ